MSKAHFCPVRELLLNNMDGFSILEYIKRAALEAVGASAPCEIKLGVVGSVKPLGVMLEQRVTLTEKQLILPRRFTDHAVRISGGNVGGFYFLSDDRSDTDEVKPPHVHALGEMEITVHGALEIGDNVILIRQQGGQKYLIFDVIAG